ncbi:MAG: AmmeMemoRadiSam system protein B [Candidatus Rokubacteria bacterium RIFCSPHIGHO2_12_FULL_73_22]|nr:MAG: AmmeMemoRadiSam system protein B [Candidatus Rokubacteria bacterium RIFCSPHIGHO2_12_FULL_73_22]OGL10047.1 MAG: AmmeMemoRadiSam system protein B [Candidatus Rokubacteria bacterium RIFCSPLOWO2_02_FULL_73_56]OGL24949.1 MAG: AmmeMemoRadiSam system protein B [Candidatus Rokubacteria bacterium RIFCSPLOWO2_12_FULL_73_47]
MDVRPSPIAGQWYPADAAELAAGVDRALDAAGPVASGAAVVAVVAPHAGHVYSGGVAGHAFAAVRGLAPELVAVVGPMHVPARGALLTSAHEAYATPLGPVPLDAAARAALDAALAAEGAAGLTPVRDDDEHSVEIELPFLQRALVGAWRLLPVMVRDARRPVALALGRALARALANRRALLVASTDLSHYHPQAAARRLDAELLRRLEAFDADAVLRADEEGAAEACGVGALAAVLWAARALGADRVRVLRYATSGDVTGDYRSVVGYAAAVATRP